VTAALILFTSKRYLNELRRSPQQTGRSFRGGEWPPDIKSGLDLLKYVGIQNPGFGPGEGDGRGLGGGAGVGRGVGRGVGVAFGMGVVSVTVTMPTPPLPSARAT